jgi:hypothetical protein
MATILPKFYIPCSSPRRSLIWVAVWVFSCPPCKKNGAKITAIDNDWVKELETAAPIKRYVFHDLNQPFASKKRFDLATSFEVAEHLDPERSEPLVQELCALSDTIAFSAAIPGQSGSGHINLKW